MECLPLMDEEIEDDVEEMRAIGGELRFGRPHDHDPIRYVISASLATTPFRTRQGTRPR